MAIIAETPNFYIEPKFVVKQAPVDEFNEVVIIGTAKTTTGELYIASSHHGEIVIAMLKKALAQLGPQGKFDEWPIKESSDERI
jgi:hypothetical protein